LTKRVVYIVFEVIIWILKYSCDENNVLVTYNKDEKRIFVGTIIDNNFGRRQKRSTNE